MPSRKRLTERILAAKRKAYPAPAPPRTFPAVQLAALAPARRSLLRCALGRLASQPVVS